MAKQYYCFLERFNNYFNRKIIRHKSLEDYQNASKDFFIPELSDGKMTPFDFNPNDNITTEIIVNSVPFDPDYFLLLDEDAQIVSRWFVMEIKRNRQGQWLYFLRRDVLADSYEALSNAPLYVEKGVINDINSPLLMNNEDLRVNQIKKEEILLKDKSNSAWLVIYLKKGALGNNTIGPSGDGTITLDVPANTDFVYEKLNTPIASWSYYQYVNNDYKVRGDYSFITRAYDGIYGYDLTMNNNGQWSMKREYGVISTNLHKQASNETYANELRTHLTNLINSLGNELGYLSLSPLMAYNDKIIEDSTGKFFKVRIIATGNTKSEEFFLTSDNAPLTKNLINTYWNNANGTTVVANDSAFKSKINWMPYRVVLEELTGISTTVNIGSYRGHGTVDSMLFDAICMPYGEVREFLGTEVSYYLNTTRERSLKAMNSIATQLTSQWVLDFQLLPFCPVQNVLNDYLEQQGEIAILSEDIDELVLLGISTEPTDAILVCPSMNLTFDIGQTIEIQDTSDVPDVYKTKYLNDCVTVRLCSPNYNGIFEMNLAKNGGKITSFNVDMTLRPFNPYIHINPDFNFLYGQDFNDIRGLICNGDFSLGIINDAWNVYEIQNKNYQAIFDRQIQNLDINNKITMEESIWGAVAGTVGGAGAGAVGGFVMGGGYGALAGGVIGGVASGVGGVLDIENLRKRQQEARSYAVDNYNLSLGNVRALPNSITKTSALTYNNKLFAFVEIYECSEEEKNAYYLKLKYNGMKVGIIDTMLPYRSEDNSNYFRARLIRITNISEDNHYLEVINEELMKGVFI